MLTGAGFTDVKIEVKENAAEIIKGWMPGSGAEKYVTSAYVTAFKPLDGKGVRDDVHRVEPACCEPSPACCEPPAPAPKEAAAPAAGQWVLGSGGWEMVAADPVPDASAGG